MVKNKEVIVAVVVNDFLFECFKKGMTAAEAIKEAAKHVKELDSVIEGITNL